MSIFISGLEAPLNCRKCELQIYGRCIARSQSCSVGEFCYRNSIPDDCPVSDATRMVSIDNVKNAIIKRCNDYGCQMLSVDEIFSVLGEVYNENHS